GVPTGAGGDNPGLRRWVDALPGVGSAAVLLLPAGVRAQPARPALRHRSVRSGEVDDAGERKSALAVPFPVVELPRRAPLLPAGALLPAPAPEPAAAAVLPEDRVT